MHLSPPNRTGEWSWAIVEYEQGAQTAEPDAAKAV